MRKITSLRTLKKVILLDLRARRIMPQWRILLNPVVRFQLALRVYEYLINTRRRGAAALFKLYFRSLSLKLGFSIPPNVFGPGLCIVHYGTIVVSPRARVGRNCRVHAGVNIGGKAGFYDDKTASRLCTIIGSNCYIGPGAKIFGPVVLAAHCKIGANAVVTRSFLEEKSVLVGVPAQTLK
ncbi:serine O-acetyltransferase [Thiopseudomonas alkaliphila]|uniref:serine O-acetyltransferase n=1 Tax=Thiopseudomonas alkaliphila TaxID=1697053 RepID=UPI00257859C6|nr:DapH/DapD/GlmU-related protein [Thiopseudomonas alkaliphila]MDM1707278.1 serine acetyltransferase [Thiopseudomonas alkaliphila]